MSPASTSRALKNHTCNAGYPQNYPPQQGYPQQGYPQQGYPPQQGGYPPQVLYKLMSHAWKPTALAYLMRASVPLAWSFRAPAAHIITVGTQFFRAISTTPSQPSALVPSGRLTEVIACAVPAAAS